MAFVSLRLGRPAGRIILYGIAAYYFLFAPRAARSMRAYLRRALDRAPRARDRFRLIMNFATGIHDRVYLLTGRYDLFKVTVCGEEKVRQVLERPGGAVLMGAHVGSHEIVRMIGERDAGLSVTMAMYGENARKLNAILAAIAPGNHAPEFITVGHVDSMLRLRERLAEGALIGLLGDRRFGDGATLPVSFLGATAPFPTGPMRIAATLRAHVVFMCGLYRGGNHYHVVFEPIADFSDVSRAERAAAIEAAIHRYVAVLERCCREDPYNWYNFFDFWQEDRPEAQAGETRVDRAS
jgi:predicted LPLAT superfamily acyltransferase